MCWFFGPESYGILALRPGIEPAPAVLEVWSLTGPPGKSWEACNFMSRLWSSIAQVGICFAKIPHASLWHGQKNHPKNTVFECQALF